MNRREHKQWRTSSLMLGSAAAVGSAAATVIVYCFFPEAPSGVVAAVNVLCVAAAAGVGAAFDWLRINATDTR